MHVQLFYIFLCMVVMASGLPISSRAPPTSPPRYVRSSACMTPRDHSTGTCDVATAPSGNTRTWLTPCAGSRRAGSIGPGHPLYQTPSTPTPDPQCQLDMLRTIEGDLNYIMDHYVPLSQADSREEYIALAHKYNVPTLFKCRQGQSVTEWIQAGLVTFAAHWEEVWKGDNLYMADIDNDEDCSVWRANNVTRKNIGDMLCQVTLEVGHDPIDTCAAGYTGSGACHAPSTSSLEMTPESADMLDRWARDKVVNLYFQKFIRKAKRLIRNRIL